MICLWSDYESHAPENASAPHNADDQGVVRPAPRPEFAGCCVFAALLPRVRAGIVRPNQALHISTLCSGPAGPTAANNITMHGRQLPVAAKLHLSASTTLIRNSQSASEILSSLAREQQVIIRLPSARSA